MGAVHSVADTPYSTPIAGNVGCWARAASGQAAAAPLRRVRKSRRFIWHSREASSPVVRMAVRNQGTCAPDHSRVMQNIELAVIRQRVKQPICSRLWRQCPDGVKGGKAQGEH